MTSLEDLSLVAMAPSTRERVHACLAARKQQSTASGSPRQQQQHNSSGRVGGGVGAVAPCTGLLATGVSVCPQSERNLVGLLDLDLCTVLASVPAARVVVYWRTNVVKSALASALSSRSTRRTFVDEATSAATRGLLGGSGDGAAAAVDLRAFERELWRAMGYNENTRRLITWLRARDAPAHDARRRRARRRRRRLGAPPPSSVLVVAYEELQVRGWLVCARPLLPLPSEMGPSPLEIPSSVDPVSLGR